MPESRECWAHYLLLKWFYDQYGDQTPLILEALWADATTTEAAAGLASDENIFQVSATCTDGEDSVSEISTSSQVPGQRLSKRVHRSSRSIVK